MELDHGVLAVDTASHQCCQMILPASKRSFEQIMDDLRSLSCDAIQQAEQSKLRFSVQQNVWYDSYSFGQLSWRSTSVPAVRYA